jgi:stage IV sporulation protein FB
MLGSFLLTEIRGVPIRLHFTAFFLLPWVYSQVPSLIPALTVSVLILASVALHELGHTVVSQRYGVHVQDIVLTPLGGMARLTSLPENPRHEVRIALAGPYVSLLLALLGLGLTLLGLRIGLRIQVFAWLTALNLMLFLFNLLPSFPMDGGRILRGCLTRSKGALEATRIASTIGKYMAIAFIVLGLSSGNFPLALIGVFILMSAGSEYRMMQMKHLHQQQMGRGGMVMDADFTAGPPPYAKSSGPTLPDNLLGDIVLTFRDLVQEVCATCFNQRP